MNKYIRTKINIYKISRELKNGAYLVKGRLHINKETIIAEADTKEELCDGFILRDADTKAVVEVLLKRDNWTYEQAKEKAEVGGYWLLGFIKTPYNLTFIDIQEV